MARLKPFALSDLQVLPRIGKTAARVIALPLTADDELMKDPAIIKVSKKHEDIDLSQRVVLDRPKSQRVNAPVQLATYFRRYRNGEEPKFEGHTSYMNSSADIEKMNKLIDEVISRLEEMGADESHLEAETDYGNKASLLNGSGGSSQVPLDGLINVDETDFSDECWQSMFRWLSRALDKLLLTFGSMENLMAYLISQDEIALFSNHGWGTWNGTGSETVVDIAVHYELMKYLVRTGGSISAAVKLMREEGLNVPYFDPCCTLFFRRQGSTNGQLHLDLERELIILIAISFGILPRERKVFGVPTFINLFLRLGSLVIRAMLYQHGGIKQKTSQDRLIWLLQWPVSLFYYFSEDISGFDHSVTYAMQMSLSRKVYKHFLDPSFIVCYEELQSLGVLGPQAEGPDGSAELWDRKGMTISGSMTTNVDGTILNRNRQKECVLACFPHHIMHHVPKGGNPYDYVDDIEGTSWISCTSTDDCSLGIRRDWLYDGWKDVWDATSARCGFGTTGTTGVNFLSVSFDLTKKRQFGLANSAIHKLRCKEKKSVTYIVDIYAAFYRAHRIAGNPAQDIVERDIFDSELMSERNIHDMPTLYAHIRSDEFISLVSSLPSGSPEAMALRRFYTGVQMSEGSSGLITGGYSALQATGIKALIKQDTHVSHKKIKAMADEMPRALLREYLSDCTGLGRPKKSTLDKLAFSEKEQSEELIGSGFSLHVNE